MISGKFAPFSTCKAIPLTSLSVPKRRKIIPNVDAIRFEASLKRKQCIIDNNLAHHIHQR